MNIDKEFKVNEFKYEQFKIKIDKSKLDISGNPFRTKDLFNKFGIELESDSEFNSQKEGINAIVVKRNKVVHHNDDASDVSAQELINNIELLTKYIDNIDKLICRHLE